MNNLSILLGILFMSIFTGTAPRLNDSPDIGLVAYYSFNDCDAFDDGKQRSPGKIFGSGTCRCGVEGNGLQLNGTTDYIEFSGPVNDYFTTSDFTISLYFKPLGKSIFKQSLLSKRTMCTEENLLDVVLDQQNNTIQTQFIQEEFIAFGDLSAKLKSGDWHHFALVRKGSRAYTYVNGKLMNESRRCSGVDIANETPLGIGNSPCVGKGMHRFKGIIDELRVYDNGLTHQQIMDIYSRTKIEDAEKGCVS